MYTHMFDPAVDNSESIHSSGVTMGAPNNFTSRHAYSSPSGSPMPVSFHPSSYDHHQQGLTDSRSTSHAMPAYHENQMYKAADSASIYELQRLSSESESYTWSHNINAYVAPENFPEQSYSSQEYLSPPASTTPFQSPGAGVHRPPVLSWPLEYFVTSDPSLVSSNAEVISDTYANLTPNGCSTPELVLYTSSSSCDESGNVFDMQFGDAIGSSNSRPIIRGYPDPHMHPRRISNDSSASSSASSPSPLHDLSLPSRRSPHIRTPSPSSSEFGTPTSSDHRRRFPCLLAGCARRFTSQYTLKVHMEAHKPKPKVTFPCTQGCSERFSRQHDRLRHEVAKHGKVCEFSCDECGRFFSTSKTLGNHKCPLAPGGTRWVHV